MRWKIILSALIIGVGIVGGAWFLRGGSSTSPVQNIADSLSVSSSGLSNELSTDSDRDGLADWEERLWNTDVDDTDTDGDGTSDGDEVRAQRNPAIAGPDDSLTGVSAQSSATLAASNPFPENSFVRSFAENYTEVIQGKTLTDAQKTEMAARLLIEAASSSASLSPRTVSIEEIRLSSNTDSAYRNYRALLKSLLAKYPFTKGENPSDILYRAMNTGNRADYEKLAQIAALYEGFGSELLAAAAPPILSPEHVDLINSAFSMSAAVNGFRRSETDPLLGVAAVSLFVQSSQLLGTAFVQVSDGLRSLGAL